MYHADSTIDPTLPEELGDVLQVGGDVFEVGRAAGDAVPVRAGVARPQDEVCTGFISRIWIRFLITLRQSCPEFSCKPYKLGETSRPKK